MKKYILMLCIIMMMPFHTAYANVIGKAVSSDIIAYINDLPISSYNINGYTGIIAEELENYGFSIYYDNNKRLLEIYYDEYKEVTANGNLKKNTTTNIYQTDITTRINDKDVPCYNIGGQTIILIDSLDSCGNITWKPEQRKIYFDSVPSWEIYLENDYKSDTSKEISNFTIEITKNEQGTFDSTGENRQYISNVGIEWNKNTGLCIHFSIYQNVLFQTSNKIIPLLNDMITIDKEGKIIQQYAHIANEHINININEKKSVISSVKEGRGNGHIDYYLYLDTDIKNLNDVQTITIECK